MPLGIWANGSTEHNRGVCRIVQHLCFSFLMEIGFGIFNTVYCDPITSSVYPFTPQSFLRLNSLAFSGLIRQRIALFLWRWYYFAYIVAHFIHTYIHTDTHTYCKQRPSFYCHTTHPTILYLPPSSFHPANPANV